MKIKSFKKIYCTNRRNALMLAACGILFLSGCKGVPGAGPETGLETAPEAASAEMPDPQYLFAGTSAITVKPGRARTIAVGYHSGDNVDESLYVWTAADQSVVSIRGMGSKCVIVGKQEGGATVVVTHPGIPLPYAFRVACTADEAVEKKFRRTAGEWAEGRLVGGWSSLEMVESFGN